MPQESPEVKSISSENTRYPTSKKKQGRVSRLARVSEGPQLQRRTHSLHEEINSLKQQLKYYCGRQDYRRVSRIEHRLHQTQTELSKESFSRLREEQAKEKNNVVKAYKREIKLFQSYWRDNFEVLRQREYSAIRSYQQEKKNNLEKAKWKINQKCNSLRQKSVEIIGIEKKEAILKKMKKWRELEQLKKQKKYISQCAMGNKQKAINRWLHVEENNLNAFNTKRYNNMMLKLGDSRKDQERRYLREQRRLKQKYKNVLRVMEHQQIMQRLNAFDYLQPQLPCF